MTTDLGQGQLQIARGKKCLWKTWSFVVRLRSAWLVTFERASREKVIYQMVATHYPRSFWHRAQ
jgi:hypothetical protein